MSHAAPMTEATPDGPVKPQSDIVTSPRRPQQQHVARRAAGEAVEADITARKSTRTFDYIWRSGVAGGMAGCAVSKGQPGQRRTEGGDQYR